MGYTRSGRTLTGCLTFLPALGAVAGRAGLLRLEAPLRFADPRLQLFQFTALDHHLLLPVGGARLAPGNQCR